MDPDDLIALYKILYQENVPIFITTDLLIHSLHLLFNRMLENTENQVFFYILKSLVRDFLVVLKQYETNRSDEYHVLNQAVSKMKYFFEVGEILLSNDVNIDAYDPVVREEITLINNAARFAASPVFGYEEDYSQYKPRGHYTAKERLKSYFKAMMWLGRINFFVDKTDIEQSKKLTPSIILLTGIMKNNQGMLLKWRGLTEPINYIVGKTDDLNFFDIFTVIDMVDSENPGDWLENEDNVVNFINAVSDKCKKSKIISTSTGVTDIPPPSGFRFMGQRFTLDSFIHNRLSSPRVDNRTMVKGIDIMAVFGNPTGETMLQWEMENLGNFKTNFDSLAGIMNSMTIDDWRASFYNGYLRLIKEITTFDEVNAFCFTNGDRWKKKALLTSHGAWAELRHDTILYVEQSYAEGAGGCHEPTFEVEPVPLPGHYIEPNLGFFYWLQTLLEDSIYVLSQNGILNETYSVKFKDMKALVDKLTQIVEYEAGDRAITEQQNTMIAEVPFKLAEIILPVLPGGYIMDMQPDMFEMPLIADVHTDSQAGEVLEVATGIPYRLFIALNDRHGGKRIAVGYTYSYYEFTQPIHNLVDFPSLFRIFILARCTSGVCARIMSAHIVPWLKEKAGILSETDPSSFISIFMTGSGMQS